MSGRQIIFKLNLIFLFFVGIFKVISLLVKNSFFKDWGGGFDFFDHDMYLFFFVNYLSSTIKELRIWKEMILQGKQ